MLFRTFSVSTVLALGLVATEMKYIHIGIEPISVCQFQNGLCDDGDSVYLAEGGLNIDSTSTSASMSGATPNASSSFVRLL